MPMRGPVDDLRPHAAAGELERRLVEPQAVVLARHAERLAEPAGTGAEEPRCRRARAARASRRDVPRRLERADQHRARDALAPQTKLRHQWMPYER